MLIKKFYFTIILLIIFVFCVGVLEVHGISASCAVVINADTKEVLFEKNAYTERSMASTTKMMTSIIAIESGELNLNVTATADAMAEGTSIGLKEGYVLTLESLVYGMLLESGNDAANLCALYLGGSYENFADLMNEKAKQIGMTQTNFVTPSGLDDDEHYTTAYDMALLGAYCIDNSVFRDICSAESKSIKFIEPDISLTFYNHNKLLRTCEGVFGIKTGFTKKSGRCLVTACERNGATLICVTLNAPDDWNDHIMLYDSCFSELSSEVIEYKELTSVEVYGSDKSTVGVKAEELTYFYCNKNDEIERKVYIPKIIYAPIEENQVIGCVEYFSGDNLIGKTNIYTTESADSAEETYSEKFSFIRWIKNIFGRD